jgi:uncharacterized protein with HEPN domain
MPPDGSLKHLHDIRAAAARVVRYAAGRTRPDYGADDYFRCAVEQQSEIIGEAINRLLKSRPRHRRPHLASTGGSSAFGTC